MRKLSGSSDTQSIDSVSINPGSPAATEGSGSYRSSGGDFKDQHHDDGISEQKVSSPGHDGNTADPEMASLWQEDGDSLLGGSQHYDNSIKGSTSDIDENEGRQAQSDIDSTYAESFTEPRYQGSEVDPLQAQRTEMNFSGRKIESFNRTGIHWVSLAERLTVLNLSNNRLSSLGIKSVGVDGQLIDTVPPNIPMLTELNLSRNGIQHLGSCAFAGYPNLRHLDLSYNKSAISMD